MSHQVVFLVLVSLIVVISGQGIGTQLSRTALLYENLPLTSEDAISSGWYNYTNSSCDESIGIPYAQHPYGPSEGYPIQIYFTADGQISGMSMTHFGSPLAGLEQFWVSDANGDGNFMMSVSFRPDSDNLCVAGNYHDELLGTQLVINQDSLNWAVPLTDSDAANDNWTKGGCISDMGTHWSYDLKTAPVMSWVPNNLLPVVAMYNEGNLSAFFFTTPILQYSEPLGPWEGPIPDALMCLNWCDSSCGFGVSFWNTLHFFITDPSLDQCPSRCDNDKY